jgi:hypothetical protein
MVDGGDSVEVGPVVVVDVGIADEVVTDDDRGPNHLREKSRSHVLRQRRTRFVRNVGRPWNTEQMDQERWRPVVGWESYYEVSDQGRVRRVARTVIRKDGVRRDYPQRLMAQSTQSLGYKVVHFKASGRCATKHVHVLVLTAFIGMRPAGMVGCHNDGNPANNRLENLRWDTQSSNLLDAVRHGTHTLAAATHCKRGHEFTPANIYYSNGWRHCRQCLREGDKRRYKPSPRGYGVTRTHCKQGHEYTPANTYVSPRGTRDCRICIRDRLRRSAAARRRKAG